MSERNKRTIGGWAFGIVFLLLVGATSHARLHTVENFKFYLGESIQKPWIKLINRAEESIHVGMYFAMSDRYVSTRKIYNELANAKKRGVDVYVGIDKKENRLVDFLKDKNINVRVYSDNSIQHLKAIVVDGKYVFVGSQNLTPSALRGKNWSSGVIFKSKKIGRKVEKYLKKQN